MDGKGAKKLAIGGDLSHHSNPLSDKIREADRYLGSIPEPPVNIVEMHPEVSIARWNGAPLPYK